NVLQAAVDFKPDLILLDINLPDQDGFSVCSRIQADFRTTSIPIIFLTGRSSQKDKVVGFNIGAEDYITKPFDPAEFRARIDATNRLLKKFSGTKDALRLGNIEINKASHELYIYVKNQKLKVELSRAEYKLLMYMITNANVPLARNQILKAVWGDDVAV